MSSWAGSPGHVWAKPAMCARASPSSESGVPVSLAIVGTPGHSGTTQHKAGPLPSLSPPASACRVWPVCLEEGSSRRSQTIKSISQSIDPLPTSPTGGDQLIRPRKSHTFNSPSETQSQNTTSKEPESPLTSSCLLITNHPRHPDLHPRSSTNPPRTHANNYCRELLACLPLAFCRVHCNSGRPPSTPLLYLVNLSSSKSRSPCFCRDLLY